MGRSIYPPPGAKKPPQRIHASFLYGATDVTIAAVNVNKTHINIVGGVSGSGANAPGWFVRLINSTTLRFTSGVGGGVYVDAEIELLEDY